MIQTTLKKKNVKELVELGTVNFYSLSSYTHLKINMNSDVYPCEKILKIIYIYTKNDIPVDSMFLSHTWLLYLLVLSHEPTEYEK